MYESNGRTRPAHPANFNREEPQEAQVPVGATGKIVEPRGLTIPEADGYYSDDDMGDDELDLSFLDEEDE